MTDDLAVLDATAQAALVRDGTVSPRELVDAALARIDAVNPELNAVIHRRDDRARSEADAAPDGPFRGVPILVKDLDGSLAGEPLHLGQPAAARASGTPPTTTRTCSPSCAPRGA